MAKRNPDPFDALFIAFSSRIERVLLWLLILLIGLLLISQCLMQFSFLRPHLNSIDRLEGIPYRLPDQV